MSYRKMKTQTILRFNAVEIEKIESSRGATGEKGVV